MFFLRSELSKRNHYILTLRIKWYLL